jgi:hypothetical protein
MDDSLKQFPEEVEAKLDSSLNEFISQIKDDNGYYPMLRGRREIEDNFYNLVRANISNPVVDKFLIDFIHRLEETIGDIQKGVENEYNLNAREFVSVIFTNKINPLLNAEIHKLTSDSEKKDLKERIYKIVDKVGGIKGFNNEYTFDYAYSLEGTQDDKILRLESSYLKLTFFYSDDYKNPNKHDLDSPSNFKVQQLWANFRRDLSADLRDEKTDLLVISLMNVIKNTGQRPFETKMMMDNLYSKIKDVYIHNSILIDLGGEIVDSRELNLKERFNAIQEALGIKIEG